MATIVETSISIPEALLNQAQSLAQQLNLSQSDLVAKAIEEFIKKHPAPLAVQSNVPQSSVGRRVINQGEIYWVQLESASEEEAAIPHPYVIIQDNLFNHSRLETVVACALTSNTRRTSETPGNLLLEAGEANLPKQSVVEVSKVSTIDKTQLGEYIGTLTEQRINQILAGMRFLQMTFFNR